MKADISEISENPQGLVLEAIHSAGFSGPLANPLLAPESAINRLNSTLLEDFVAVSLRKLYIKENCAFLLLLRSSNFELNYCLHLFFLYSLANLCFENFRRIILLAA